MRSHISKNVKVIFLQPLSYLLKKRRSSGRSVLLVFLETLRDHQPAGDALRDKLHGLVELLNFEQKVEEIPTADSSRGLSGIWQKILRAIGADSKTKLKKSLFEVDKFLTLHRDNEEARRLKEELLNAINAPSEVTIRGELSKARRFLATHRKPRHIIDIRIRVILMLLCCFIISISWYYIIFLKPITVPSSSQDIVYNLFDVYFRIIKIESYDESQILRQYRKDQKWLKRLDFSGFPSPKKEDLENCKAVLLTAIEFHLDNFELHSHVRDLKEKFMYIVVDFNLTERVAKQAGYIQIADEINSLSNLGYILFFERIPETSFTNVEKKSVTQAFAEYLFLYNAMLDPDDRPITAQIALLAINPYKITPPNVRSSFANLHESLSKLSNALTTTDDDLLLYTSKPISILIGLEAQFPLEQDEIELYGGAYLQEIIEQMHELTGR